MRSFRSAYWFIALFGTLATAHMSMSDPAPILHTQNSFSAGQQDYDYNNPLSGGGDDFPCKGYHEHLNSDQGQPVAEWTAGQSYSMTVGGGAAHGGGSCQLSFSHDGGQTFKVIHSYIGNCPSSTGDTSYQFTIPPETPSAERALFAWTWFNNIGNREMYMNCAVVSISGGGSGLDSRPNIFEANIGNDCLTMEGSDVDLPNPGPDVTSQSSNTAPPVGRGCESGPGAGQVEGAPEPQPESPDLTGEPGGGGWLSPEDGGQLPPPDANPGGGNGAYTPGNDFPAWFNNGASVLGASTKLGAATIYIFGHLLLYFLRPWIVVRL